VTLARVYGAIRSRAGGASRDFSLAPARSWLHAVSVAEIAFFLGDPFLGDGWSVSIVSPISRLG
jgi:hypothetical protein